MKPGYLAYLLLPGIICVALPATAQHSHDHRHAPTTAAVAIPTQRHATDAALREGMSRIHTALDELTHYEMGHMPQSLAVQRVDTIKEATDQIFANCKLDPEADGALHGMLVPLINGIQAFRKNPADTSTIATMRQAVADYPRVFDDPAWPLTAGAEGEREH